MLDSDETWFVHSVMQATVDDIADLEFLYDLQEEALELLKDVCSAA